MGLGMLLPRSCPLFMSPPPASSLPIPSHPRPPTSSSLTHCMESWLQCTHRALRRMVSLSNSCSWKAWVCGGGGEKCISCYRVRPGWASLTALLELACQIPDC